MSELSIDVELHGRTDVGLIREHNEDNFSVVRLDDACRDIEQLKQHSLGERGTLLIVCDGMGGAAAGEIASQMAVDRIEADMLGTDAVGPPDGISDDGEQALVRKLREAARHANQDIYKDSRTHQERSGMGTTMTAMLLRGAHALIAQVGDSRAYVWRAGAFTQVTRDQSLVNQLIETGQITQEQAKHFEHSNVILQALGVQDEVEVQLSRVALRRGDRFLLCSDGLVGVVSDEEISAVLGSVDDLSEATRILCDLAKSAGGPDNISVIVARVGGEALPEPGAEELIEYKLWKIDPPEPPRPTPATTYATFDSTGYETPPAPGPSTAQLISIAVIVGLVLGAFMTGIALYKTGVVCEVLAPMPGARVWSDGKETGGQMSALGTARIRLRPGKHTLEIKAGEHASAAKEVDVPKSGQCQLTIVEANAVKSSEAER